MNRRETKGKGEKERYAHLNAEFQREARRDKRAFLSEQLKKTEESNRMGKARDLSKKIRDSISLSSFTFIKRLFKKCSREHFMQRWAQ